MPDQSSFKKLLSAFRDTTNIIYKKHEKSNALIFIKKTIEKLEKVIKTLDELLKKRNINVGVSLKNIKSKGKELLEKTKELYNKQKEKSFIKAAKAKAINIKSKLMDLFKKENETDLSPPEESNTSTENLKQESLYEKVKSKFSTLFDKYSKFFEKRSKEIEEEKKAVRDIHEKEKEEKESSLASKFSSAKGLGKKIISVIPSFASRVTKVLKDKKENKDDNNKDKEDKSKERKSWLDRIFSKQKERQEKRSKEIEEEKKAVQERLEKEKEKDKKDSWFSKILSAIGKVGLFISKAIFGLGQFLIKGIGKIAFSLGKFIIGGLGKAILRFAAKGLGSLFTKINPFLSSKIAKATSGLVRGGIKTAAKIAGKGIKIIGRALPTIARGALGLAGRAGLMLLTGPVGWAAAAGTAIYAGYKLYKYLTRNNIKDDINGKLTRLRLLMYGFNDAKKEHYYKVFNLEMLMKDYVDFKDYKVMIKNLTEEDMDKILEIFGITREETDKRKILMTWFTRRFLPAYKAFLQALYSINNSIYLDEIDRLKPIELFDFLTRMVIPTSIYNIKEAPTFDDTKIYVTKDEVDSMLTNIINEVKEKAKEKDSDITEKIEAQNKEKKEKIAKEQQQKQKQIIQNRSKTQQEIEDNVKKNQTQSLNIEKALPEKESNVLNNNVLYNNEPISEEYSKNNIAINKTFTSSIETKTQTTGINVKDKLIRASGELYPGDSTFEGLKLRVKKEKVYSLDPNVFQLFTGMAKEYHDLTGKKITINEAFRTREDQARLYAKDTKKEKAAKPGTSTHEFGLAIDIQSEEANELEKLGLMRKYGFTRPIGQEKWHLEPIGVSMRPRESKEDKSFRLNAIVSSIGRGGAGYALLPNSRRKGRNIDYQEAIYKNNDEVVINPLDIIKPKTTSNATFNELIFRNNYISELSNKTIQSQNKQTNKSNASYPLTITTTTSTTPSTSPKTNKASVTANVKTDNISSSTSTKTDSNIETYSLDNKDKTNVANYNLNTEPKVVKTTVSPYRAINTITQTSNQKQAPIPQQNIFVDTKNLEKLMLDQLDTLKLIAKILTSIDDKFDVNLLKELAKSKSQQTTVNIDKSIPKNSINLSRKPVEAR